VDHAIVKKEEDLTGFAEDLISGLGKSNAQCDDEQIEPFHHEFNRKETTVIEAPVEVSTPYEASAQERAPLSPV
jgi:hypothetical protein